MVMPVVAEDLAGWGAAPRLLPQLWVLGGISALAFIVLSGSGALFVLT